jgi:DNA-binding response OmpR family regulator
MIVDDDHTMVSLLETLLKLEGFEVVVCPRGNEVLEKARAEEPDLFMMDYNLTDIDGVELVKRLRSDPDFGDKPIVIASGMNVEMEVERAGADAFLTKPFEPGKLAGLFTNLIRSCH